MIEQHKKKHFMKVEVKWNPIEMDLIITLVNEMRGICAPGSHEAGLEMCCLVKFTASAN